MKILQMLFSWFLSVFCVLVFCIRFVDTMPRCCDAACSNSSSDLLKHRWLPFPSNPDLKVVWISAMNLPGWSPSKTAVLCEQHFCEDAWNPANTFCLKIGAAPSLFCRCPRNMGDDSPGQSSGVVRTPLGDTSNVMRTPMRKPNLLKKRPNQHDNHLNVENDEVPSTKKKRGRPKNVTSNHLPSCPFYHTKRSSTSSDVPTSPSDVFIPPLHLFNETGTPDVTVADNSSDDSRCVPVVSPPPRDVVYEVLSENSENSVSDSRRFSVLGSTVVTSVSLVDESRLSSVTSTPAADPLPAWHSQQSEESVLDRLNRLERLAATLTREKHNAQRKAEMYRSRYNRLLKKQRGLEKNMSRFGADQLNALALGTSQGSPWSTESINLGWKLHFACGTTGYETVSELQMPLPSVRQLNKKMQELRLHPGILYPIFELLKVKVETIPTHNRECVLVFDEMSIAPKTENDPNLKKEIGRCTLPSQLPKVTRELRAACQRNSQCIEQVRRETQEKSLNEKASKAMIFALGSSVNARWKQIVGYEFTGKSVDGVALKNKTIELTKKAHECGLFLRVVTCDMGNAPFYAVFGIRGSKGVCVNSVPHPVVQGEKLFFSPDAVHVFKNAFIMLATHGRIFLPPAIVQAFQLPSNIVEFSHIVYLQKYQKSLRWRLCPKLHSTDLVGGHFRKMTLWNAVDTLNPSTAAALKFLAEIQGQIEFLTTAWYVGFFYKWFKLMTSRTPVWALGKKNEVAYKEAIWHLQVTIYLFENLHFGTQNGDWKPCQAGVKLCTTTVLDLKEIYLEKRKYTMMFTGWLTQDLVENINSRIRIRRAKPSPKQFYQTLKKLIVSMYQRKVAGSNYEMDDRVDLLNFASRLLSPATPDETPVLHSGLSVSDARKKFTSSETFTPLTEDEKHAFYRVCGYVVHELLKENRTLKHCDSCHKAMTRGENDTNLYGMFTKMTNYTINKLVEVSDSVFKLLVKIEEFIMQEKRFVDVGNEEELASCIDQVHSLHEGSVFPDCHEAAKKLVKRFMTMRLRLGLDPIFDDEDQSSILTSQYSSRTTGASFLANKLK